MIRGEEGSGKEQKSNVYAPRCVENLYTVTLFLSQSRERNGGPLWAVGSTVDFSAEMQSGKVANR